MKKNEIEIEEVNVSESKYTKEQIVKSKKFSIYPKDVLVAMLKKDCLYSIEEAEKIINAFLERKV
jgi:hypothetical protein